MARTRLAWIVLVVAVAVSVGLLLYFRPPQESLEDSAAQIVSAVMNDNPTGALRYLRDEELEALGMSREEYREWLSLVGSHLHDFEADGPPEIVQTLEREYMSYVQFLRAPDGRQTNIGLFLVKGEGLNYTNNLTRQLVYTLLRTRWSGEKGPVPEGAAKYEFFAGELSRSLPALQDAGLTGVCSYDDVSDSFTLMTLPQLVQDFESRAERFRNRSSSR